VRRQVEWVPSGAAICHAPVVDEGPTRISPLWFWGIEIGFSAVVLVGAHRLAPSLLPVAIVLVVVNLVVSLVVERRSSARARGERSGTDHVVE
jgi:hypothetical protein